MRGRDERPVRAVRRKLRSRRGMTLTEILTAVAIFGILSSAIVVGTNSAIHIYRRSVVLSESRTLVSTLAQGLSDELRYVQNIRTEGSEVVFDSAAFGPGVSILGDDGGGIVRIGTESRSYDLISARAYSGGLKAAADMEYEDGIFTVGITVSGASLPARTTELQVRALNP